MLIRADRCRTWQLADACAACTVAIPPAATAPEAPASCDSTARESSAAGASCVLEEPGEWIESL
ncbi:hypothetical protein GCM10022384_66900 [Streptomyces marokkonensis]|uniref:Uncharacterized protein n=1 Tax=Streptomyces marokkonensis TaxID=324855 RepID=A0ABP7SLE6_9ACTN